jgi:homoserine kinase
VTQSDFVQQMANTASLVTAFATGDHELARHALVDLYAEPRRAALIGSFYAVKEAAMTAGALGCTISGAGPSVFALLRDESSAINVAKAMQAAFFPIDAGYHVGRVANEGARRI